MLQGITSPNTNTHLYFSEACLERVFKQEIKLGHWDGVIHPQELGSQEDSQSGREKASGEGGIFE